MTSQRAPTVRGGNTCFQPFLDLWFEAGRAAADQAWTFMKNGTEVYLPGPLRQRWLGEGMALEENFRYLSDQFALWQKAGRVGVIADDGTVLEPYVLRRYAHLPLVVGNGAEARAREFLGLLDRHPELRGNVRASVLVAERRWNLRLKNGVDVRLPEFDLDHALDQIAGLERDSKLSGRDITAIDLRLPDRITVRLSEAAAEKRDEAQKKRLQPKPKGGNA